MAGKLCNGRLTNNMGAARLSGSKAFCEGILYRSGGTGIARPISDNPHEDGAEDSDAWDTGWDIANDAAGGSITKTAYGCCAPVGIIPV